MARISIILIPPLDNNSWRYDVQVTESDGSSSKTTHQVTLEKDYYLDMTERGRREIPVFGNTNISFIDYASQAENGA